MAFCLLLWDRPPVCYSRQPRAGPWSPRSL